MSTKINVRSPFYYRVSYSVSNLPPVSMETSIEVFIYSNASTSVPSTPTYSLTSDIIEYGAALWYSAFELSELIRDYIDYAFDGTYSSGTNTNPQTLWVAIGVNGSTSYQYFIALDGYGYYEEGSNPELSRSLLISNTTIWRPVGEEIRIPIFNEDSVVYTSLYNSTLISGPSTLSAKTTTYDFIQYASILSTANKVVISNTTAGEETTIYIKDMNCSVYPDRKITFINKFGALQDVYFFAKEVESISISKSNFKPNITNFSSAPYYSSTEHHKKVFDVNGVDLITLHTGYVSQDYNEVMKQMMLSERVWLTKDSNVYPVNVVTNSLSYMTSLNDQLVSYSVDFEYAFDSIQNVR